MKKILIIGFPHSGTTILRKVIGKCHGVYEVPEECEKISKEHEKKSMAHSSIVIKFPLVLDVYKADYKEFKIVFIHRNPVYSISSINRRDIYGISGHNIGYAKDVAKAWLREKELGRCICVRYEDLFKENKSNFNKLLKKDLGLIFPDTIYEGSGSSSVIPPETDNYNFRRWQMDHPVQNMNTPLKIELTPQQEREIKSVEEFKLIYPEGLWS